MLAPRLSGGGGVAMHEINIDEAEKKICCDCIDWLWMGGNPEKLKKVQHSTVCRTDNSEEGRRRSRGDSAWVWR